MKIINLYGAPGAGKSTGAAYIFSLLKLHGINAELITEYAKDKCYEESVEVFKNQIYIFGKQYFRITRCQDKVDFIITDSPILLSLIYNKDKSIKEELNKLIFAVNNKYENLNYYITRVKEYNPSGRFQNEEESNIIGNEIKDFLDNNNIKYKTINGDILGYASIIKDIIGETI